MHLLVGENVGSYVISPSFSAQKDERRREGSINCPLAGVLGAWVTWGEEDVGSCDFFPFPVYCKTSLFSSLRSFLLRHKALTM